MGLPGQLPMQFALEAIHPLADVQGSVDQTCLPMSSPFTLGKKSRSHQLKALEKPCTQWPHMATPTLRDGADKALPYLEVHPKRQKTMTRSLCLDHRGSSSVIKISRVMV